MKIKEALLAISLLVIISSCRSGRGKNDLQVSDSHTAHTVEFFIDTLHTATSIDDTIGVIIAQRRLRFIHELDTMQGKLNPQITSSFYATISDSYTDKNLLGVYLSYYEYVSGAANGRSTDEVFLYDLKTLEKISFEDYFMISDSELTEADYFLNLSMEFSTDTILVHSLNELMFYPIKDSINFVLPPSQLGLIGKQAIKIQLAKDNPNIMINPKYL